VSCTKENDKATGGKGSLDDTNTASHLSLYLLSSEEILLHAWQPVFEEPGEHVMLQCVSRTSIQVWGIVDQVVFEVQHMQRGPKASPDCLGNLHVLRNTSDIPKRATVHFIVTKMAESNSMQSCDGCTSVESLETHP
jgi:hypothetical protein